MNVATKSKKLVDMKLKRKLVRAAKETVEKWRNLGSSVDAEALQTENFQVKPIYADKPLPINIQLLEMEGKAKSYPHELHKNLISTVVPLREEYRKEPTIAGRKQIATVEFTAWRHYLINRKELIANEIPDFHIDGKIKSLLKEQFDRLKHRDTLGIPSSELVEFHNQFAKKFKFTVPLNPRHFGQMIHPYQGYLCNFPNKHFLFNELVEVYENQIAAGLERCTGRNLFADELSCLSFWMVNNSDKGHLTWAEFQNLLTAFRFKIDNLDQFKTEFQIILSQSRKELIDDEPVFRFDLARQIFLERGL